MPDINERPKNRRRFTAKTVPKYDRRLIGTWQSDRRRTFHHFKPKRNCTPKALMRLRGIFGKLVIRWGRAKFSTQMDGNRNVTPYEVVSSDSESVVVRFRSELTGEKVLQQIHFDGDHYRIISGNLIEWFRRME